MLKQLHLSKGTLSLKSFPCQVSANLFQGKISSRRICSFWKWSPYVLSGEGQCFSCLSLGENFICESKRKVVRLKEPAKLTAPVSFTSSVRLKLTLQQNRLRCKQLEQQIEEMKQSVENNSKDVDPQLHQDFLSLFSGCEEKNVPPFMK